MTRLNFGVIILVVAALLLAVPSAVVFAQGNPKATGAGGGGGERGTPTPGLSTAGSGGPTGAAVPSGGGGMASPSGGSSGGNWNGGSSGTSGSSGGSPTYGDTGRTANSREPRSGTAPTTQVSPWFSRPRGNNPATGTATVRTTPAAGTGSQGFGGSNGEYSPYGPYYGYYPGYYGNNGYYGNYGWGFQPFGWGGLGLGYSYYYDPFWSGYGGYSGYGGEYGGGYGWSTGSGYASQQRLTGSIRLKVKPAQATVYVDGYYSGRVDDFDGIFQKLRLDPGPHKIEISAPGFKSISFEVNIRAGENINFQGELEIIK
ncbi:MAG: PEGA domain-containing protein [Acidobacteria bacterium]|nr:PEGA domain-containing protein [Acidobacteriota bacterium]